MALAPQCLLQAREILTKAVEISAGGRRRRRCRDCFCGTDLAYASFGSLLLGCDIEGEKESQDYEDEQREEDPREIGHPRRGVDAARAVSSTVRM